MTVAAVVGAVRVRKRFHPATVHVTGDAVERVSGSVHGIGVACPRAAVLAGGETVRTKRCHSWRDERHVSAHERYRLVVCAT